MNKIGSAAGLVGGFVHNNSSNILTATACAGVVGTAVMAVKATPAAIDILDGCDFSESEHINLDKAKATWKVYAPAAGLGTATIACIVAARYLDVRQSAVLAASYAITEKAFTEYRAKVAQKVPEKVDEIRESIIEDRMKSNPVSRMPAVNVHEGDVLCYDVFSGRYFASDKDELDRCTNMLNQTLVNDSWVSLNTWYSLIGLHNIAIGEEFGWTTDNLVEVLYGATVADDGRPCLTVSFRIDPRADAYRIHSY